MNFATQNSKLHIGSRVAKDVLHSVRVPWSAELGAQDENVKIDDKPLIILHGLFGCGTNWRSMAKDISAAIKQNVYLLDMRNHGESFHSPSMDYPTMAQDVATWLKLQKFPRFNLMGHSMGGKAAMYFAIAGLQKSASSELSKLVIVDAAPRGRTGPIQFKKYIETMKQVEKEQMSRMQADTFLKNGEVPEIQLRQFLLANYIPPTADKMGTMRVNLEGIDKNLSSIVDFPDTSQFQPCITPTLFVGGGKSAFIDAESETIIYKRFPTAKIHRIPDASHWVHADQPIAFLNTVVPFLK